jgi:hypothetical protein
MRSGAGWLILAGITLRTEVKSTHELKLRATSLARHRCHHRWLNQIIMTEASVMDEMADPARRAVRRPK